MPEQPLLTRSLGLGAYGKDVDASKRSVYIGLDDLLGGERLKAHTRKKAGETPTTALARRRTVGPFFLKDYNQLRDLLGYKKASKVTPEFITACAKNGYVDAYAVSLFNAYADEHKPKPPPPKLVEPNQGFDSLVKDMWEIYSLGRSMGLFDLGTYNPRSKLPSGRPSDHATSRLSGRIGEPACAFDLGFSPPTGQSNPKARVFYETCKLRPEVEYVICGDRIWSRDRGDHRYIYGGHDNHVHVSGHRR